MALCLATTFLSIFCLLTYHIWHMIESLWMMCHIHDLCMTLAFCRNIKYQNYIFTMNKFLWAKSSLRFDIGIPNLPHMCINMRQHVVYIHDLCMTSNFYLYVVVGVSLVSFTHNFDLVLFNKLFLKFISIQLKTNGKIILAKN